MGNNVRRCKQLWVRNGEEGVIEFEPIWRRQSTEHGQAVWNTDTYQHRSGGRQSSGEQSRRKSNRSPVALDMSEEEKV